jgi:hypothetical protein
MPFCENCGTQVNPNSKFCRNCGSPQQTKPNEARINQSPKQNQPLQAEPAQAPQSFAPSPPPQTYPVPPIVSVAQPQQAQAKPILEPAKLSPQTPSEVVVGVMMLRKPKSLGRYDSFAGVLTNQRFILAQMTGEMLKNAAMQAKEEAKANGKGFFGQWSEQLKASFGYARKYLSMQPDAIMAETPGNFAISNNSISEIKLKLKNIGNQDMDRHEFELEIKSSGGKHEFRMDENNDYVKILKQVYQDRVKMPFGYFNHTINIKL